jgi:LuxR family quorum sensing-dependent transcriptional regulator
VIAWAAAGKSTWEVSCILGIAESTVEKHVAAAVRKLGAANKVQAVAEALRAGEIPL